MHEIVNETLELMMISRGYMLWFSLSFAWGIVLMIVLMLVQYAVIALHCLDTSETLLKQYPFFFLGDNNTIF